MKQPTQLKYYSMLTAASKRPDLRDNGYSIILHIIRAEWPYMPAK